MEFRRFSGLTYARGRCEMNPYHIVMNRDGAISIPYASADYEQPPYLPVPGNPEEGEITVYDVETNDDEAVLTSRQAPAFTYYCDLDADADWDNLPELSGGASDRNECFANRNMSGDGSAANPWKNLTYALEEIRCLAKCLCCEKFIRIVCSGEAHYSIENIFPNLNGYGRVIIEGAKIKLTRNDLGGHVFSRCENVHFYNCSFSINSNTVGDYGHDIGVAVLEFCDNCKFFNCDISANAAFGSADNVSQTLRIDCISFCENDLFYGCNINAVANISQGDVKAYGTSGITYSVFVNCEISVHSNSSDNKNSTGYSYVYSVGADGVYLNFYSCIVSAVAGSNDNVHRNSFSSAFHGASRGQSHNNIYTSTGTAESYSTRVENEFTYQLSQAYAFYNFDYASGCTANAKAISKSDKNAYSMAYCYMYYNAGVNNCNFSVSAKSNCTSSEQFNEREEECGVIKIAGECEAGSRCEWRTSEGTFECF